MFQLKFLNNLVDLPVVFIQPNCFSFSTGWEDYNKPYGSVNKIKRSDCAKWPNITSTLQLKYLLGNDPFANFAINCNVSDAKRVSLHMYIYIYS